MKAKYFNSMVKLLLQFISFWVFFLLCFFATICYLMGGAKICNVTYKLQKIKLAMMKIRAR